MSDATVPTSPGALNDRPGARTRAALMLAGILVVIVVGCIAALEGRFAGLQVDNIRIAETPVTIYKQTEAAPSPAVIVAHGFGGSRQMMDQIAVSIARQGFVVASVDLPGHGRNGSALSPDITNINGTTAQLVETVGRVADGLAERADTVGPISFVGHSMATDVVIRVAQSRDDVGGVVAISMYSPAVTATEPRDLLVISGATEGHLRRAGLATIHQLDPTAAEGETVTLGDVTRRTAVAPFVGHVGVLYAPTALDEITTWLKAVIGTGSVAPLDNTGWVAGILLGSVVLLAWPLSRLLPVRLQRHRKQIPRQTFLLALLVPIPFALIAGIAPVFGIAGHAAFGTLATLLGVWGTAQCVILYRRGLRLMRPDPVGVLVYGVFAIVFALTLDRYGAAFVPTGDRRLILAMLLIGTTPVMIADSLIAYNATLLQRLLARAALLLTLVLAMALAPFELGLTFTVIPVLVLFFVVYGSFARWVALRRGPSAVAFGQAVMLAWAIAASTPLFATTGMS